jgi:hypothetical protein
MASTYYLTWGQYSKDWMVNKGGIAENQIKVVGTLLKYQKPIKVKGDNRVLFAPRHWVGELNENLSIAETLRTLPYTVRSKIVIGEHDPGKYPNPIESARQVDGHINTCFNAIANSDVVVGLGEGTFAALCYMMDVPYISVDLWEPKALLGKLYTKKEWDSQISNACYKCSLEDLNKTIKKVLKKDTMRKNRMEFRKYALNWGKDPLREMLKIIYE